MSMYMSTRDIYWGENPLRAISVKKNKELVLNVLKGVITFYACWGKHALKILNGCFQGQ